MEESEKIYFMGLKDNEKRDENVRTENLNKTRLFLGYHANQICKKKNIRSQWTHYKDLAQKLQLSD
ncbi:DUF6037 family protein [Brevibacillus laterosporus]|uniref:DUF6037 family protein n=1 Tax=Brevibacillus laterosporus TaxID=1465 RepID=A0AAP3DJK6_BRELA|nr:DUF6037 family protein [Brevibacillus laterosporus]MCR8982523.1 DUF6037 family protein [Brevibacillus laterosporus]MCZ0809679.1 DUF6037 family protein [Brevibacillus laterosporus]MCZ0828212.1 DUF6037 family protein [Brevibacillus laterosporus]MCZ0852234.1 DUF6037 family protein [Brevibacillus laterosporus]